MKQHLPFVCAFFAIVFIILALVFHPGWLIPGIIFALLGGATGLSTGSDN